MLTGCDSSEEQISESAQDLSNVEFAKLYNSIDSLHNEYSALSRVSFADKWGRRFLVATFDACVGAITAETGPGAFICSTVASGLYDDYLDYVNGRTTRSAKIRTRSVSPVQQPAVVFATEDPNFVDSIGFYHNQVIDEIQSKGLSFIDKDGNIDYNSYYNEVIAVAKKNGISCNVPIDKTLVFSYINSIIKPFAQVEDGNKEAFLSIVFNETYKNFNFDNSKTLQLRNACDKIIYNDLSINEDQVIEYGMKVNELIVNSKVDKNAKETMKVANNIAVNSSLYWGSSNSN